MQERKLAAKRQATVKHSLNSSREIFYFEGMTSLTEQTLKKALRHSADGEKFPSKAPTKKKKKIHHHAVLTFFHFSCTRIELEAKRRKNVAQSDGLVEADEKETIWM